MGFSLVQVRTELENTRPTFEQMNINKVSFAQELEFAMQAFQANPKLLELSQDSVRKCLVNVALTGTTLNPVMKMSYLVPRKGVCCLDMSYMGLIKIITDTGSVQSIKARPVYENEPFQIELGTNGFVKHGIAPTGIKGKRIGAYSEAVLNDGSTHIEWMYESDLMAIKGRSKTSGSGTPWNTDEDEMCRKTVVKRHWKYLPKSERAILASQAIAYDDEQNGIDFEKEKREADAANQVPHATPDAPKADEYATVEDFQVIFQLLDDPALEASFITQGAGTIKGWKTNMAKKQEAGTLLKTKAEEYIKFINWEIEQATIRQQQSAG